MWISNNKYIYIYVPSLLSPHPIPFQYSCLQNPMDGGVWRATWGHKESDRIGWLTLSFWFHRSVLHLSFWDASLRTVTISQIPRSSGHILTLKALRTPISFTEPSLPKLLNMYPFIYFIYCITPVCTRSTAWSVYQHVSLIISHAYHNSSDSFMPLPPFYWIHWAVFSLRARIVSAL